MPEFDIQHLAPAPYREAVSLHADLARHVLGPQPQTGDLQLTMQTLQTMLCVHRLGEGSCVLTMQTLAPLVPTVAVVLPDTMRMLSPLRRIRSESRMSLPPSSSVLKLYPSLNAEYCTAQQNISLPKSDTVRGHHCRPQAGLERLCTSLNAVCCDLSRIINAFSDRAMW